MKCKKVFLLLIVVLVSVSSSFAKLAPWQLQAHKIVQNEKLSDDQTLAKLQEIMRGDIKKQSVYLESARLDNPAEKELSWYGNVVSIYNNALNLKKPKSADFLKSKGAKNVIKSEPLEKGMKCCYPENEPNPEKCEATAPSGTVKVYYESDPPEVLQWWGWGELPLECLF